MHDRSGKANSGPRILTAALAIGAWCSPAAAQLTGGHVVSGQAIISQPSATSTLIKQLTPSTIINWNGYSIPRGASVTYEQPSASSIALNRVLGGSPSLIYGSLTANGRVWLINRAGIVVGTGANISAASVLLSTVDIHNADFLNGNYSFDIPGRHSARILNNGTITAASGGSVVLAGAHVENEGVIAAALGTVVVAGASTYSVDFAGDGLLSFAVTGAVAPGKGPLVDNKGTIAAPGGVVLLTAQAAKGVLDNVINTSGIVEATTVASVNGKIVLTAAGGGTTVSGLVDASGKGAGETGGTVEVLGDSVTLAAGAKIDVSGNSGGGTALVGGNFHGAGPQPNAAATTMAAGAIIDADAIATGNGGNVAVWSDDATSFAGSITARGGAGGGNGGMVETSGHALSIAGSVDVSARAGQDGVWLLDPADFTICNAECTMSPAAITTALSTGEVIVEALGGNSELSVGLPSSYGSSTGNIVVSDPLVYSSANQLSLLAAGNITLDATVQNLGKGNLNLIAGWDGTSGISGSTFSVAALAAVPNSYGRNGAEITIGTASSDVFVSSVGGTTTLAAAIIDPPTMVITDPTDNFEVGIDMSGALYDSTTGIGFRRISDSYDPLQPGIPRDSWGIAYSGSITGTAAGDPTDYGNSNESTSMVSFTANNATVLNTIGGGVLMLTQFYSFAAENILRVQEAVTNTSSVSLAVLFQRDIDWDVFPTGTDEITTIPPGMVSPIVDASFYGFESPNPNTPYTNSGYPAGGNRGPGDLGGGIKLSVGTLTANQTATFDYYYGISMVGQSEASLGSELSTVGAVYTVLTDSSGASCPTCGINSAAIAVGPNSSATGFGFVGSGSSSGGSSNSPESAASPGPSNARAVVAISGQQQTTASSPPVPPLASASSNPLPGESAPPPASTGPASTLTSTTSSTDSSALMSVTDLDPGSSLYNQISGGGTSSSDPLTNVAPITPAPQPVALPVLADTPLGGVGSNLFLQNDAPVASDDVWGVGGSPPLGGNESLWFSVAER